MYFRSFGILMWLGEIILGCGLIYNCVRGLLTRESMYDSESTTMMTYSQWIGIAAGIFLLALAFGLVHLPFIPAGPFCGG